jgi:ABC-2 type transport system permease protein
MKELIVYFFYFVQFFKAKATYRLDFIFGLFSNIGVAFFSLLFILFLIDGSQIQSLGDWSRSEVLFIYGYSMLSFSFFSMLAPNLYMFGEKYIIDGQFDRVLLRPLSSMGQVLFESFNLDSIGTFILGVYVINYSASQLMINFGGIDILWLILSVISGGIILLSVFIFLATLSFYFDDKLGVGAPVYSLITFSRYPTTIFNRLIQFILSFIVPFAFASFYPATHFFEKKGFEYLCYMTPIVAIICLFVAIFFWQLGVRKYSSTGS